MASDSILRSLTAGAAFGAALTASRVYLPIVIINQMRLRDFHMLEVFLSASAASAIVLLSLEKLGIAKRSVRANASLNWFSAYDGNIVGGALLGAGMGLTGACPGTVLPQLVNGMPTAPATTLGALLGGIAHAKFGKALVVPAKAEDNAKPEPGSDRRTIASKLGISPSVVLAVFELTALSIIALSVLQSPEKSIVVMPTIAGGLLIALAQTLSVVLTSTPLGVSAAYEQLGGYFWRSLGFTDVQKPPSPPKTVVFMLGILIGSFVAGRNLPPVSSAGLDPVPTLQALLGGFILVFGARMAGGCTSGHGLSGLSSLSYSSLITTAAMFGAGIVTQLVLVP